MPGGVPLQIYNKKKHEIIYFFDHSSLPINAAGVRGIGCCGR